VTFGGQACTLPVVINANTITCSTPAHAAGATLVQVTNPDGQIGTSTTTYTYQAAPSISGVSPAIAFAIGGNSLTITGSGFLPGAIVDIGGTPCSGISVNTTGTAIFCTAPPLTAGSVSITVTNTDNQKIFWRVHLLIKMLLLLQMFLLKLLTSLVETP